MTDIARLLQDLRLSVLERGWLSSNNVLLRPPDGGAITVVDTGYETHREQTVDLVDRAAGAAGVARIVNTHLHSDHCGGNAALQAQWSCETWVPEVSIDAVRRWDASRLTFELTDQQCQRFRADRGIAFGETIELAGERWTAIRAPGHDPQALMLWHVRGKVLIAGDALWESRLAIVFPELHEHAEGFEGVHTVLDVIESLAPAVVIPGHGRPFSDVPAALARSRERLASFEADPSKHLSYAARALTMFHMLEQRRRSRAALESWLVQAPVFRHVMKRLSADAPADAAHELVARLIEGGQLHETGDGMVQVA